VSTRANGHSGSSFDDFLKEEGIYDDVQEKIQIDLLAMELEKERKRLKVTKTELAKRMGTSRSAVDRLLDISYAGNTLDSVRRAAQALGFRIVFALRSNQQERKSKKLTVTRSRASA
jgi:antitoxin HicB